MKICLDELRSLPQGRLELNFNERLQDTEAVKPAVGELTVFASSTGMHLSGHVQTLLKLNCDRCLRPYFHAITVDLDERFITGDFSSQWQKSQQKDRELARDEDFCETLPPDNILDVTDVVYQAVTLATPTTSFCGSECPGPPLPTGLGKGGSLDHAKDGRKSEAKVDPRWKNLKSLLLNDDRKEK